MNADERAARDAWSKADAISAPRKGTLGRLAWHLWRGHVEGLFTANDEQAIDWLADRRSFGKIGSELDRIEEAA